MQTTLDTLQRLVNLYAAVEQMHSAQLQRSTTAVYEAQQAIDTEQTVAETARVEGRDALTMGDRVGWTSSETQLETAGWRTQRLEQIRVERQDLRDAASEAYVASRLKREQMKRVLEDNERREELEQARRMQAASDDRYLSRRRWTDAKENVTSDR